MYSVLLSGLHVFTFRAILKDWRKVTMNVKLRSLKPLMWGLIVQHRSSLLGHRPSGRNCNGQIPLRHQTWALLPRTSVKWVTKDPSDMFVASQKNNQLQEATFFFPCSWWHRRSQKGVPRQLWNQMSEQIKKTSGRNIYWVYCLSEALNLEKLLSLWIKYGQHDCCKISCCMYLSLTQLNLKLNQSYF